MISDGTPEYRFTPPGPRDEPKVVGECAWCGGEIYEGDEVTEMYTHYHTVHADCEHAYIESCTIKERGVVGADGTIE
ncbi:hypothetical protein [Paenibacillus motobuensis]|uniref:Uncharacterized protein n=1 Tax=Paenibacillus motobuensis TaxID=295324 RepID=A0ABP3HNW2_9BACL